LKRIIKKTLKYIFISFSKLLLPLFFDKNYLQGRWFKGCITGWLWAWRGIRWQKIQRFNSHIPWPVSHQIRISSAKNIVFHPDDLNNFQGFGNYYQNFSAKIVIGKRTYIAPNVGIITANHDPLNLDEHLPGKDVVLGEDCWIGMNSVILPGVILGPHTTVGAGSVVTKSFTEGHCLIVGNPASIKKRFGP